MHQRDNTRLIETLMTLRDRGNTVIVVEHDEHTMLAADHLIEASCETAGRHNSKVEGSRESSLEATYYAVLEISLYGEVKTVKALIVEFPQQRKS